MIDVINIGIIGAGAIGCLFGGNISKVKYNNITINVTLYTRERHKKAIRDNGLILEQNGKKENLLNLNVFTEPKYPNRPNINDKFPFQYLFLTTKTYDLESAIDEYCELIKNSKYFIILQNGIGNVEIVKKKISHFKILRAVTSNGALMERDGYIIRTGEGITKIGFIKTENSEKETVKINKEDKKNLETLKTILNLANLETEIVDNIESVCWEKIFINVGINSFGALTGLRNGELLKIKGLRDIMKRAVIEAVKVAKKKGIELKAKNYVKIMLEVAKKTSMNKNSMLQDILSGKNKTEISFINEKIVSYGKQLGVDVSINEVVSYLIHGLENANK